MELTSENDLFFHYTHSLDEQGFRLVQEQQKLMVDFAEYAAVLIRMLNTCIKVPLMPQRLTMTLTPCPYR